MAKKPVQQNLCYSKEQRALDCTIPVGIDLEAEVFMSLWHFLQNPVHIQEQDDRCPISAKVKSKPDESRDNRT